MGEAAQAHAAGSSNPAAGMTAAVPTLFSQQEFPQDLDQARLPVSHVSVQSLHGGTSGVTILHIQDAHSNLSGQKSLAAALDEIMTRYPVDLVLVEGGSTDVTLDRLKAIGTRAQWKQAADRLLFEGLISGEEYLNLTSEHPMRLQGIEKHALYSQSVKVYDTIVRQRRTTLPYLRRIGLALDRVKNKTYPKALLDYEAAVRPSAASVSISAASSASGVVDFGVRTERLLALASDAGVDVLEFDAVMELTRLKKAEKRIDFARAQAEEEVLLTVVYPDRGSDDFKNYIESRRKAQSSPVAQLSLLKDLLERSGRAREDLMMLGAYLKYLENFSKLDMAALLPEMELLEDTAYRQILGGDEDARMLRVCDRFLELLQKAYRIRMSSDEFRMLKVNESDLPTKLILGFLNRKLAELGYLEDLTPYETALEDARYAIELFYRLVDKRDRAFMKNAQKAIAESGSKVAVMITGGYHTAHLEKLMRARDWSYAVLTPMVQFETDQAKYESILLAPLKVMRRKLALGSTPEPREPKDLRVAAGSDKVRDGLRTAAMAEAISLEQGPFVGVLDASFGEAETKAILAAATSDAGARMAGRDPAPSAEAQDDTLQAKTAQPKAAPRSLRNWIVGGAYSLITWALAAYSHQLEIEVVSARIDARHGEGVYYDAYNWAPDFLTVYSMLQVMIPIIILNRTLTLNERQKVLKIVHIGVPAVYSVAEVAFPAVKKLVTNPDIAHQLTLGFTLDYGDILAYWAAAVISWATHTVFFSNRTGRLSVEGPGSFSVGKVSGARMAGKNGEGAAGRPARRPAKAQNEKKHPGLKERWNRAFVSVQNEFYRNASLGLFVGATALAVSTVIPGIMIWTGIAFASLGFIATILYAKRADRLDTRQKRSWLRVIFQSVLIIFVMYGETQLHANLTRLARSLKGSGQEDAARISEAEVSRLPIPPVAKPIADAALLPATSSQTFPRQAERPAAPSPKAAQTTPASGTKITVALLDQAADRVLSQRSGRLIGQLRDLLPLVEQSESALFGHLLAEQADRHRAEVLLTMRALGEIETGGDNHGSRGRVHFVENNGAGKAAGAFQTNGATAKDVIKWIAEPQVYQAKFFGAHTSELEGFLKMREAFAASVFRVFGVEYNADDPSGSWKKLSTIVLDPKVTVSRVRDLLANADTLRPGVTEDDLYWTQYLISRTHNYFKGVESAETYMRFYNTAKQFNESFSGLTTWTKAEGSWAIDQALVRAAEEALLRMTPEAFTALEARLELIDQASHEADHLYSRLVPLLKRSISDPANSDNARDIDQIREKAVQFNSRFGPVMAEWGMGEPVEAILKAVEHDLALIQRRIDAAAKAELTSNIPPQLVERFKTVLSEIGGNAESNSRAYSAAPGTWAFVMHPSMASIAADWLSGRLGDDLRLAALAELTPHEKDQIAERGLAPLMAWMIFGELNKMGDRFPNSPFKLHWIAPPSEMNGRTGDFYDFVGKETRAQYPQRQLPETVSKLADANVIEVHLNSPSSDKVMTIYGPELGLMQALDKAPVPWRGLFLTKKMNGGFIEIGVLKEALDMTPSEFKALINKVAKMLSQQTFGTDGRAIPLQLYIHRATSAIGTADTQRLWSRWAQDTTVAKSGEKAPLITVDQAHSLRAEKVKTRSGVTAAAKKHDPLAAAKTKPRVATGTRHKKGVGARMAQEGRILPIGSKYRLNDLMVIRARNPLMTAEAFGKRSEEFWSMMIDMTHKRNEMRRAKGVVVAVTQDEVQQSRLRDRSAQILRDMMRAEWSREDLDGKGRGLAISQYELLKRVMDPTLGEDPTAWTVRDFAKAAESMRQLWSEYELMFENDPDIQIVFERRESKASRAWRGWTQAFSRPLPVGIVMAALELDAGRLDQSSGLDAKFEEALIVTGLSRLAGGGDDGLRAAVRTLTDPDLARDLLAILTSAASTIEQKQAIDSLRKTLGSLDRVPTTRTAAPQSRFEVYYEKTTSQPELRSLLDLQRREIDYRAPKGSKINEWYGELTIGNEECEPFNAGGYNDLFHLPASIRNGPLGDRYFIRVLRQKPTDVFWDRDKLKSIVPLLADSNVIPEIVLAMILPDGRTLQVIERLEYDLEHVRNRKEGIHAFREGRDVSDREEVDAAVDLVKELVSRGVRVGDFQPKNVMVRIPETGAITALATDFDGADWIGPDLLSKLEVALDFYRQLIDTDDYNRWPVSKFYQPLKALLEQMIATYRIRMLHLWAVKTGDAIPAALERVLGDARFLRAEEVWDEARNRYLYDADLGPALLGAVRGADNSDRTNVSPRIREMAGWVAAMRQDEMRIGNTRSGGALAKHIQRFLSHRSTERRLFGKWDGVMVPLVGLAAGLSFFAAVAGAAVPVFGVLGVVTGILGLKAVRSGDLKMAWSYMVMTLMDSGLSVYWSFNEAPRLDSFAAWGIASLIGWTWYAGYSLWRRSAQTTQDPLRSLRAEPNSRTASGARMALPTSMTTFVNRLRSSIKHIQQLVRPGDRVMDVGVGMFPYGPSELATALPQNEIVAVDRVLPSAVLLMPANGEVREALEHELPILTGLKGDVWVVFDAAGNAVSIESDKVKLDDRIVREYLYATDTQMQLQYEALKQKFTGMWTDRNQPARNKNPYRPKNIWYKNPHQNPQLDFMREKLHFEQKDILSDKLSKADRGTWARPGSYRLIRDYNLLSIYFSADQKAKARDLYSSLLEEGGYLMVGRSSNSAYVVSEEDGERTAEHILYQNRMKNGRLRLVPVSFTFNVAGDVGAALKSPGALMPADTRQAASNSLFESEDQASSMFDDDHRDEEEAGGLLGAYRSALNELLSQKPAGGKAPERAEAFEALVQSGRLYPLLAAKLRGRGYRAKPVYDGRFITILGRRFHVPGTGRAVSLTVVFGKKKFTDGPAVKMHGRDAPAAVTDRGDQNTAALGTLFIGKKVVSVQNVKDKFDRPDDPAPVYKIVLEDIQKYPTTVYLKWVAPAGPGTDADLINARIMAEREGGILTSANRQLNTSPAAEYLPTLRWAGLIKTAEVELLKNIPKGSDTAKLPQIPLNSYAVITEAMPGRTLGEILRMWNEADREVPLEEIQNTFRSLVKALAALHQAGLFNRDISPEDIHIDRADGEGRPVKSLRVGDWGAAVMRGTQFGLTRAMTYLYPRSDEEPTLAVANAFNYVAALEGLGAHEGRSNPGFAADFASAVNLYREALLNAGHVDEAMGLSADGSNALSWIQDLFAAEFIGKNKLAGYLKRAEKIYRSSPALSSMSSENALKVFSERAEKFLKDPANIGKKLRVRISKDQWNYIRFWDEGYEDQIDLEAGELIREVVVRRREGSSELADFKSAQGEFWQALEDLMNDINIEATFKDLVGYEMSAWRSGSQYPGGAPALVVQSLNFANRAVEELSRLEEQGAFANESPILVLDLGSGSGVVSLAVSHWAGNRKVEIHAYDSDPDAATTTRVNWQRGNYPDNVNLHTPSENELGTYGTIFINAPDVRAGGAEQGPVDHQVLTDLDNLRRMIATATAHVSASGRIFIETNVSLAEQWAALLPGGSGATPEFEVTPVDTDDEAASYKRRLWIISRTVTAGARFAAEIDPKIIKELEDRLSDAAEVISGGSSDAEELRSLIDAVQAAKTEASKAAAAYLFGLIGTGEDVTGKGMDRHFILSYGTNRRGLNRILDRLRQKWGANTPAQEPSADVREIERIIELVGSAGDVSDRLHLAMLDPRSIRTDYRRRLLAQIKPVSTQSHRYYVSLNNQVAGGVMGKAVLVIRSLLKRDPTATVDLHVVEDKTHPEGIDFGINGADKRVRLVSSVGMNQYDAYVSVHNSGRSSFSVDPMPHVFKPGVESAMNLTMLSGSLTLDPERADLRKKADLWSDLELSARRKSWMNANERRLLTQALERLSEEDAASGDAWDLGRAVWSWGYFQSNANFKKEAIKIRDWAAARNNEDVFVDGGRQVLIHLSPGSYRNDRDPLGPTELTALGFSVITEDGKLLRPEQDRRVPVTVIWHGRGISNRDIAVLQCQLSGTAWKDPQGRRVGFPVFVTGTASWLEGVSSGSWIRHDGYQINPDTQMNILVATLMRSIAVAHPEIDNLESLYTAAAGEAKKQLMAEEDIYSGLNRAELTALSGLARESSSILMAYDLAAEVVVSVQGARMAEQMEFNFDKKPEEPKAAPALSEADLKTIEEIVALLKPLAEPANTNGGIDPAKNAIKALTEDHAKWITFEADLHARGFTGLEGALRHARLVGSVRAVAAELEARRYALAELVLKNISRTIPDGVTGASGQLDTMIRGVLDGKVLEKKLRSLRSQVRDLRQLGLGNQSTSYRKKEAIQAADNALSMAYKFVTVAALHRSLMERGLLDFNRRIEAKMTDSRSIKNYWKLYKSDFKRYQALLDQVTQAQGPMASVSGRFEWAQPETLKQAVDEVNQRIAQISAARMAAVPRPLSGDVRSLVAAIESDLKFEDASVTLESAFVTVGGLFRRDLAMRIGDNYQVVRRLDSSEDLHLNSSVKRVLDRDPIQVDIIRFDAPDRPETVTATYAYFVYSKTTGHLIAIAFAMSGPWIGRMSERTRIAYLSMGHLGTRKKYRHIMRPVITMLVLGGTVQKFISPIFGNDDTDGSMSRRALKMIGRLSSEPRLEVKEVAVPNHPNSWYYQVSRRAPQADSGGARLASAEADRGLVRRMMDFYQLIRITGQVGGQFDSRSVLTALRDDPSALPLVRQLLDPSNGQKLRDGQYPLWLRVGLVEISRSGLRLLSGEAVDLAALIGRPVSVSATPTAVAAVDMPRGASAVGAVTIDAARYGNPVADGFSEQAVQQMLRRVMSYMGQLKQKSNQDPVILNYPEIGDAGAIDPVLLAATQKVIDGFAKEGIYAVFAGEHNSGIVNPVVPVGLSGLREVNFTNQENGSGLEAGKSALMLNAKGADLLQLVALTSVLMAVVARSEVKDSSRASDLNRMLEATEQLRAILMPGAKMRGSDISVIQSYTGDPAGFAVLRQFAVDNHWSLQEAIRIIQLTAQAVAESA